MDLRPLDPQSPSRGSRPFVLDPFVQVRAAKRPPWFALIRWHTNRVAVPVAVRLPCARACHRGQATSHQRVLLGGCPTPSPAPHQVGRRLGTGRHLGRSYLRRAVARASSTLALTSRSPSCSAPIAWPSVLAASLQSRQKPLPRCIVTAGRSAWSFTRQRVHQPSGAGTLADSVMGALYGRISEQTTDA